jgi:hypothetical protein
MYGGSDLQAKEYHLLVRAAAGARSEKHSVDSTNHAEPSFTYHLLKILVCRRHYAHIDSSCLRTPKPFDFLLLNRTQELGLEFERQFANFVEQKRAAIRRLKVPIL